MCRGEGNLFDRPTTVVCCEGLAVQDAAAAAGGGVSEIESFADMYYY